jgi:hypothetical protein
VLTRTYQAPPMHPPQHTPQPHGLHMVGLLESGLCCWCCHKAAVARKSMRNSDAARDFPPGFGQLHADDALTPAPRTLCL